MPRPRATRCDDIALVYRAAQESVRNVIKHARAHRLTIRLTRAGRGSTLEVTDDGARIQHRGSRRRQQNGHVGLSLLQERVAEAGATIAIDLGSRQRHHHPAAARRILMLRVAERRLSV